jgi:hypothetical protein
MEEYTAETSFFELHGVTTRRTSVVIVIAARTSNSKYKERILFTGNPNLNHYFRYNVWHTAGVIG